MRRVVTAVVALAAFYVSIQGLDAQRPLFTRGGAAELETARSLGAAHLTRRLARWGVEAAQDLVTTKVAVDELSMAHTRVQQHFRGIPVFGGEAIVHMRSNGAVAGESDSIVPFVRVDTKPQLDMAKAIDRALTHYGCRECLTDSPRAQLWVLRLKGVDRLVYKVDLIREDGTSETAMPVVFVDAHSGDVVYEYNNLQTASGNSLYSGVVTIGTSTNGSSFYLENTARRHGTFDFRNTTTSVFRFVDPDDLWNSAPQRAAVDAQFGAERFLEYLQVTHGRNGIDGAGGPGGYASALGAVPLISSRVHYGTNYNNAFWNGQFMTYGDGDGSTFSPLVTLDIAGHEMMHGVTERTAGLVYSGESGALNESWSDVFGAMNERFVRGESANIWKIGEQAYTPANGTGDALRFMDNPHAVSNGGFTADDDPDHYSERYTGSADNGGVHINSGIANKAFYLLAAGGTHHLGGSMTGIGADNAARIWYRALTFYMTSSTNFAGARTATLSAAADLFGAGGTEHTAVATAWCMVGVGSCSTTPPPPPTGDELIVNGGFETMLAPWVSSGAGALWTGNGNFPHGGTGYIYLGNTNSSTGQSYQQISISPTATTANLSFWLNVTSAETTTSIQYDRLFVEVRNTSGTLLTTLATFSNLNKGTAGNYVLRGNYNLLAYAGQTVRVQFRSTTDSSLATVFRIDDVSVK
jgi:thermolysin